MSSFRLRKEIIRYCQRLDAKGFVANHDGNISARLSPRDQDDRFLATPTARAKFDLKEDDLITVDLTGKTRSGGAKIFGEWAYHAAIYRNRADVTAVVHAHCPQASALGLGGEQLPVTFWPEGIVSLGSVVPCVSPGSPDFPESIERLSAASRRASACLVQGNGVFAWGSSLEQAYLRLELVEHLCQLYMLSRNAGLLRNLPTDTVSMLLGKRKKAGLMAPEESTDLN